MPTYLYFAADLTHVLLSLPYPPPPSLWFKPASADEKPRAVFLLTPQTYCRLLWQVTLLRERYINGDYSTDKIDVVNQRWNEISNWAVKNINLSECFETWVKLEKSNGPRVPLQQPEPLPPNPFNSDRIEQPPEQQRYNGYTRQWEPIAPTTPVASKSTQ
jgi:hypothetical protein